MGQTTWLEKLLDLGRLIIPRPIFEGAQPIYHYLLALAGAIIYGFPSRKIHVVMITGTKGKTTTCEMVNAILEEAGYRTALASTLRLKIAEKSKPNKFKMTIRGRFFLQHFLRQAVNAGCTHAIIEMTSEGAKQFRHKFIALDALIFTNLAPEHIESHGSYEKYRDAKLSIAQALEDSPKLNKVIIANIDDKEGQKFLAIDVPHKVGYQLTQAEPYMRQLPGDFNAYNWLAAISLAKQLGIREDIIKRAVSKFTGVRGRMETVIKEPFEVVVDYAHTPESLTQAYQAIGKKNKICVLGSCGGGRDRWKRPIFGELAAKHCQQIILTNEDPYDEDPQQIIKDIAYGIKEGKKYEVVLDRREAIRQAMRQAKPGEVIIITGKGTDPYIMGPKGSKLDWDDASVVREEFSKLTLVN
jgi:UDP-N-acetylmuramoyl-L-alanyl-D-glutamate--2,6-diaminopimelate ligase